MENFIFCVVSDLKKVLFKRVAECMSKYLFSATKCAITKAMKKTFPYRCRPLPSEVCAKFLEKVTKNKRAQDKIS